MNLDLGGISLETAGSLVVGCLVLLFGRRLYWLCIGGFGFLCGSMIGAFFMDKLEAWAVVLLSVTLGLACMIAVVFLQKVTIILAGAVGGGILCCAAVTQFNPPSSPEYLWAYFAVGGVLGGLMVMTLFQWALVLLSAGTGAALVARSIPIDQNYEALVLMVLFLIGFVVQAGSLRRQAAAPKQRGKVT